MQNDRWFLFQDENILLIRNHHDQLILPTEANFLALHPFIIRKLTLDKLNVCAEIDKTALLPHDVERIPLRKALEILGDSLYSMTAKAFLILNWDKNHQFCGRCAQPTIPVPHTFERRCIHCHLSFYPRISPSIIVLVKKNDQLLMARSPHFQPGIYGLIAGFVEAGENIEEAAHREVKEEVGIEIKNLHYWGSQSWPFPDSLMIGLTAEHASNEIKINTQEIEDAGWYRFDNLPGRPSSKLSIASKLIDDFIHEQALE